MCESGDGGEAKFLDSREVAMEKECSLEVVLKSQAVLVVENGALHLQVF